MSQPLKVFYAVMLSCFIGGRITGVNYKCGHWQVFVGLFHSHNDCLSIPTQHYKQQKATLGKIKAALR